jgi:amidohydrolase
MPHLTVDPIWVAAQIISHVQGLVSRETDPLQPLVISFGTIQGGTIYNIIPEKVRLTGTVRTLDEKVQAQIEKRLKEVCQTTCQTWRADCDFSYDRGYPVLVNPEDMIDFVRRVVKQLWGEDRLVPIKPVMGGEDFAYYLKEIPGAFFFFGAGNQKSFPHHHPRFDIDEAALPEAAFLLATLAWEYLVRGE